MFQLQITISGIQRPPASLLYRAEYGASKCPHFPYLPDSHPQTGTLTPMVPLLSVAIAIFSVFHSAWYLCRKTCFATISRSMGSVSSWETSYADAYLHC